MAVAADSAEKFQSYAHPESLVSTDWLAEHLDDPNVVIVESDEDVLLYHTGHIPNAIKIDWVADLNDPLQRDYLDAEQFAALMSKHGISPSSTVVFYGDNFNWWAAYA
jgi:thiosulfate/3-mercaptopyruvate sulfurtransferase